MRARYELFATEQSRIAGVGSTWQTVSIRLAVRLGVVVFDQIHDDVVSFVIVIVQFVQGVLVLLSELQVRIVRGRLKLVSCQSEESERDELRAEFVKPAVLEGQYLLKRIKNRRHSRLTS